MLFSSYLHIFVVIITCVYRHYIQVIKHHIRSSDDGDLNYHKWPRICSVCRNHNPILSSFMTCHQIVTKVARRATHVEQKLFTLPEHLSSPPVFCEIRVVQSLFFCVVFYISFVPLSFFTWSLHCLYFFNLRLMITVLVSSNFFSSK